MRCHPQNPTRAGQVSRVWGKIAIPTSTLSASLFFFSFILFSFFSFSPRTKPKPHIPTPRSLLPNSYFYLLFLSPYPCVAPCHAIFFFFFLLPSLCSRRPRRPPFDILIIHALYMFSYSITIFKFYLYYYYLFLFIGK